jgi:chromosome partitioning protein
VGKTTICLNLALAMAERGRATLVVDLDPQGGVGHSLARGDTSLVGLADALMERASVDEAILNTKLPALSLMPRGRLDPTDVCAFETMVHTPGVLDAVLKEAESGYDIVILDTPAGLGMLTRAALRISEFVLIPLQGERLALRTISQILRVIEHVRDNENPELEMLGILPTMVDKAKEPSLAVLVDAWSHLCGVLDTIIPRADVFAEASHEGIPIGYLGGPPSPEARRFELLANEVETLMDELKGAPHSDVGRQQRQLL